MRDVQTIKDEITARFGFLPPFFSPALNSPPLLENLWQQTLLSYVENPIPNLFKEKLAALCARYCAVPYCLICHSSTLRPLGLKASQVLELLETPPLSSQELIDFLDTKINQVSQISSEEWPEDGSNLEEAILICALSVFLQLETSRCLSWLKKVLNKNYFDHLIIFISYNRTCLSWAEAHPDLSHEADKRVIDHLGLMIEDEPKLADFFKNYQGKRQVQLNQREGWLTEENRRLIESERKIRESLEETVQKLVSEKKVRQKFVDALTHDLRTPLTAVKMSLQLMARKKTSNKDTDYINKSLRNVNRLNQMIEDLLDASRIQGGEGPALKKEESDLKTILKEICEDQTPDVTKRVFLHMEEAKSFKGFWDPQAIKRVVENILSNAIKYGYENTPVNIDIKKVDSNALVSISNLGGLKEKDIDSIFIPFKRLEETRNKGWGIGLSIVKNLIEEHGGSIDLKLNGDKTTFSFKLPLLS